MTNTAPSSSLRDLDWLALCLASESNQPHEWQYIAWTIKLRVEGQNRYPNTYRDVVLQPSQFSYFNLWTDYRKPTSGAALTDQEIWRLALKGYAGAIYTKHRNLLDNCAAIISISPIWQAPFPLDTLHYYSLVSMKPKGSKPAWLPSARLLITPSGVDPQRFVFAAGVA